MSATPPSSERPAKALRFLLVGPEGALLGALAEDLAGRCGPDAIRRLDPTASTAPDSPYDHDVVVVVPRRGGGRDDAVLIEWVRGAAAQAGRLILISSAMVHEPSHRHCGHLDEARLARRAPNNRIALRWRGLEGAILEAFGDTDSRLTILRPTALPLAGTGDPIGRLFSGRLSTIPAGYDPSLQLLSPGELGRALLDTVRTPTVDVKVDDPGSSPHILHVAPLGVTPLRRALSEAGIWRLPLPVSLLRLLRRLGGRDPDEVEYLRYPWTVSDAARRGLLAREEAPSALHPRPDSDPEVTHDPFGLDRGYVRRLGRTLFRFLHDLWWRIEWRDLEHVPGQGGAVLVANHRGHQPWDGVMILHRLVQKLGRFPRFLLHPTLVKFPHLAPYMIRCGGLHACRENGDWVLAQDEMLAVFPEGIRGAFSPYATAHRLRHFRLDYVRMALRHQVPIIPMVVLGSAEIFPILAKIEWSWWKRWSEWPTLPVTPTFSLVPLPSKWHIQVLEPLAIQEEYGPEAADDPEVVRAIDRRVRRRMAETLEAMHSRRRSIFHGSVFDDSTIEPTPEPPSR